MNKLKFLPFILVIIYKLSIEKSNSISENIKLILLTLFVIISVIILVRVLIEKKDNIKNKFNIPFLIIGIIISIILYLFSLNSLY